MSQSDLPDIQKQVRARLLGVSMGHRNRVEQLITRVLGRLPEQDLDRLLEKNLQIILPSKNSAEAVLANPFSTYEKAGGLVPVCLVCLKSDAVLLPDHEFIYVVAHELAHVFLDHWIPAANMDVDEMELAADRQVLLWGFEESLRKTSYNYLYGSGLDNYNPI